MNNSSYALLQEVRPYLDVNEDVLWYDKPAKLFTFTTADLFTTIFGIFWLGFSIFWVFSAFEATKFAEDSFSLIFPFFGLPFVLVGLYLAIFKHIFNAIRRKNIIYALTNNRALIVYLGKRQYVQEYRYENITNVQMQCNNNDVGSIFFLTGAIRYSRNGRSYASSSGLFGIRDTKRVYKILSQQLEKKL